jgi:hypothetical protein
MFKRDQRFDGLLLAPRRHGLKSDTRWDAPMLFESNACPTLAAVNLRPQTKGTVRALLDIEVTGPGIVLHDRTWHRHAGREWIALPKGGVATFLPSASEARR